VYDVIEKLSTRDNSAPGDYEANGVRMCGRCHSPKQAWKEFKQADGTPHPRLVPIACRCDLDDLEQQKDRAEKQRFDAWMSAQRDKYGIASLSHKSQTFALDDRRNAKLSDTCRQYVERWEEMRADNMGMLFYGSVGTGKSFYACSIANALLEKRVPAVVTNFPRLLNLLQGAKERQEYLDHLQLYHLLVVDDLGVERDSPYAIEQVYNVIEARDRSGLPLIVTTNLSMEDLKNPPTMQLARIYDRVLELCPITVKMTGASRRAGNAEARRAKAREILLGGDLPPLPQNVGES
jgi:DNA replication protein DnaC